MATALDVITRALRMLGAVSTGEVPSADEAADGLTTLQGMLGQWETRGVRLGGAVDLTYATATTIPVPVTHYDALSFNLAVALAPEYGKSGEALAAIIPQAERTFRMLQAQYCKVPSIGADPAVTRQRGILGNVGWGEPMTGDGALYSDGGPLFP